MGLRFLVNSISRRKSRRSIAVFTRKKNDFNLHKVSTHKDRSWAITVLEVSKRRMSTEVNCWQLIATLLIVVRTKAKRTFFIWLVRFMIYSRKKIFILRSVTNEWCVRCATASRSTHKAEPFIKKDPERIKRNYIFRMHWFFVFLRSFNTISIIIIVVIIHRRPKWNGIWFDRTAHFESFTVSFSQIENDVGVMAGRWCTASLILFTFVFWFRAAVACSFTLRLPNM